MVQLNFDASQVAPDMGRDPIPAGWYNATMEESEMKPTKDGLGAYLNCKFNILDGQFAGRKVYSLINLKNANTQAVEIAFRELSAIAHAVGVLHVTDSVQLHGLPLKIKVKIETDKTGKYEDSNRITMYKNINEVVEQPKAASAPATSAFVPPPAAALPPVAPPPPAAPPAPPAPPAAIFPPEGWTAHPSAPGFYYAGQEVLSEADLRARFPVAPPAPAAPPSPPVTSPAAPAAWAGTPQPWAGAPAAGAAPPGFAPPPAAGNAGQAGATAPAAPAAPAAAHPAQSAPPPWAQPPA